MKNSVSADDYLSQQSSFADICSKNKDSFDTSFLVPKGNMTSWHVICSPETIRFGFF